MVQNRTLRRLPANWTVTRVAGDTTAPRGVNMLPRRFAVLAAAVSLSERLVVALLLSLNLLALAPFASASPPDPTWIGGIYDAADHDDEILAAASLEAVVQRPLIVANSARLVRRHMRFEAPVVHATGIATSQTRAPPAPTLAILL